MQIKKFAWLNVCASQTRRAVSYTFFLFLIFSPLGSSHFNNSAFFTLFDSASSWDIFLILRLIWDNWGEKIMQEKLAASPLFSVCQLIRNTEICQRCFNIPFLNKKILFQTTSADWHKLNHLSREEPLSLSTPFARVRWHLYLKRALPLYVCNDNMRSALCYTELSARYLRWFFSQQAYEQISLSLARQSVLKISSIRAIKAAVLTPLLERNAAEYH